MNLRAEVSHALVERGFARVGRTHLLREDDQFSLWVDTGPLGPRSDIVPFIGLRHDRVNEIDQQLRGVPSDPHSGTVGGNVGKVIDGRFRRWDADGDVDEVMAVIGAGLDALRPYMTLERLPDALEAPWAVGPSDAYRLVVVHLLLGDRDAFAESLQAAEEEYCQRDDEICATYRRFATKARRMMDDALHQ